MVIVSNINVFYNSIKNLNIIYMFPLRNKHFLQVIKCTDLLIYLVIIINCRITRLQLYSLCVIKSKILIPIPIV